MSINIPISDTGACIDARSQHRQVHSSSSANTQPDQISQPMQTAQCEHVMRVVASYFGLPIVDILAPSRGKQKVAFARQLAMYLAHTHYQLPMPLIARTMGRDRSTIGFGCRKIEDMRDDLRTDTIVSCLELLLSNGDLPINLPANQTVPAN
ncbi:MAG: helix-turn-helix domain-containing protein [Pseudomonadota bacterium]